MVCLENSDCGRGVFRFEIRINILGGSPLMDNPYQKLEKIGAGSFSTVYKGSGEGAG